MANWTTASNGPQRVTKDEHIATSKTEKVADEQNAANEAFLASLENAG